MTEFNFIKLKQMLIDKEKSWRKDVFCDEFDGIIIDTCFTPDTGQWETGVHKNEHWTIVQMYDNREIAEKYHKLWVEEIKKNPN